MAWNQSTDTGFKATMDTSASSSVNLETLRYELMLIKGVVEKRLDEITVVFEIHLAKSGLIK